jgi:outer membrane protein assembly factor BamB
MLRAKADSFRLKYCLLLILIGIASPFSVNAQVIATTATPQIALSQPLTLRWRYPSNLTLNLTPAFDRESIYVPLAGGAIVALKASDGQLRWRSEIGGELSASPAADDRLIYVASEIGGDDKSDQGSRRATGTLRALGHEGGVTQWMRTLAKPLHGALVVKDGLIFAGGADGKFYSFEARTGQARWGLDYSAAFNSHPIVAGARVYVGSEDGSLLAIDKNTGKLIWRYRSKGPVRGPAAVADDTVFFGSGDGHVYAVNLTNGKLRWRNRTGASVQAVASIGEGILVASLDNFVYLYSFNGSRLWKRQLPGRIASQPFTTADGALFTPLSTSAAVVLGLTDGRPVNTLPTDEEMTTSASPVGIGDAVFLTTQHGLLSFAQPRERATKSN